MAKRSRKQRKQLTEEQAKYILDMRLARKLRLMFGGGQAHWRNRLAVQIKRKHIIIYHDSIASML